MYSYFKDLQDASEDVVLGNTVNDLRLFLNEMSEQEERLQSMLSFQKITQVVQQLLSIKCKAVFTSMRLV